MVHVIFSAAIIMVHAMLSGSSLDDADHDVVATEDKKTNAAASLSICFRALDETSRVFERAKHVRESLLAIQSRWDRERRKRVSSKRMLQQRKDSDTRKRRNTGLERPGSLTFGSSMTHENIGY